MKTKHFKSALTNSVLSIEILKDFWSMFPDLYKYDDPKKAFNYANSENFKDNIFEFNPQLVPYHDYDADISKFEMTENAGKDSDGIAMAQMKFEIADQPITAFSDKVQTYQARGPWNPNYDAWTMGLKER